MSACRPRSYVTLLVSLLLVTCSAPIPVALPSARPSGTDQVPTAAIVTAAATVPAATTSPGPTPTAIPAPTQTPAPPPPAATIVSTPSPTPTPVVVDQEQPIVPSDAGEFIVGGRTDQRLAQTFTAGVSGALVEVALPVQCASDATLRLEIQTAAADGRPTGTSLAAQAVAGSTLPTYSRGAAFRRIAFGAPAPITAGTLYAIVASATSPSGSGCHWYIGPLGDPYPRGAGYGRSSTTWNRFPQTRNDFGFRTVVAPGP